MYCNILVTKPFDQFFTYKFKANQNIKKGNLREIYYGSEAEEIHNTQGKKPECSGCLMRCMSSASAMLNMRGQIALFSTYAKNLFFATRKNLFLQG